MAHLMGFANEFYTLWDVTDTSYVREDGTMVCQESVRYIQNVSKNFEKACIKTGLSEADDSLRGQTLSFNRILNRGMESIIPFGKHREETLQEILDTDESYFWFLVDRNDKVNHITKKLQVVVDRDKNKEERAEKIRLEKEHKHIKDLQSVHFAEVGDKIAVKACLECSIFLYTNYSFNYLGENVFLNIFRTEEGNIIIYKGSSLYEKLNKAVLKPEVDRIDREYPDRQYKSNTLEDLYSYVQRGWIESEIVSEYFEQLKYSTIKNMSDYDRGVHIFYPSNTILLTGTVKENTVHNDVKQTVIQRPNLKYTK